MKCRGVGGRCNIGSSTYVKISPGIPLDEIDELPNEYSKGLKLTNGKNGKCIFFVKKYSACRTDNYDSYGVCRLHSEKR